MMNINPATLEKNKVMLNDILSQRQRTSLFITERNGVVYIHKTTSNENVKDQQIWKYNDKIRWHSAIEKMKMKLHHQPRTSSGGQFR